MRSVSLFARLMAALATLLALDPGAATAADIEDLYQAQTIVTGEREETRIPGFRACLESVLIKVSGDPSLIGTPGVAKLADQASEFVSGFRYRDRLAGIPHHDEQGSRDRPYDLIVSFDPARIDAALRSLGTQPWSESRPRLALFIGMRRPTTAYLIASDGDRGLERDALVAAAAQRGMPITLPTKAVLAVAGLSFETLPGAKLSGLEQIAKPMGGDATLVGLMVWSEKALAWIADWRLGAHRKTYSWRANSTTFDDAFRQAMGGAAQILSGHGQPKAGEQ